MGRTRRQALFCRKEAVVSEGGILKATEAGVKERPREGQGESWDLKTNRVNLDTKPRNCGRSCWFGEQKCDVTKT